MTNKLQIRDLTLRDGQQSLFATRLKQENIARLRAGTEKSWLKSRQK